MGCQRHRPAALHAGKQTRYPLQEAGWGSGSVWTGAENLAPIGIRSTNRPARSDPQVLRGANGATATVLSGDALMPSTDRERERTAAEFNLLLSEMHLLSLQRKTSPLQSSKHFTQMDKVFNVNWTVHHCNS